MNWKECERKRPGPNFRHCRGICLGNWNTHTHTKHTPLKVAGFRLSVWTRKLSNMKEECFPLHRYWNSICCRLRNWSSAETSLLSAQTPSTGSAHFCIINNNVLSLSLPLAVTFARVPQQMGRTCYCRKVRLSKFKDLTAKDLYSARTVQSHCLRLLCTNNVSPRITMGLAGRITNDRCVRHIRLSVMT
jgi:hypothetical protein